MRKFFCHHCQRNYSFVNGFEGYRQHVIKLHLPCSHCEKELRIAEPDMSMTRAVKEARRLGKEVA